jgi:hypothetical protein
MTVKNGVEELRENFKALNIDEMGYELMVGGSKVERL